MWRHLAIFLTLCSLAAGILDMTHICKDKRSGEMVSSPFDCQAYFICNTVPQLQYCTEGLHFDNERKLCNLPIDAKCVIQTINTENVGEINNEVENMENTTEDKNENEVEVEVDAANNSDKDTAQAVDNNNNDVNGDAVNSNTETEEHSQSIFVAFDIANGQAIDPMTDYDTNHIVCRHFGAYFLPHPTNCRKYFICAYGHLHEHHCGRGTLWNYKRMECEISNEAQCFSGSEENTRTTWEELSTTTPTTDWTRTTTPLTTPTTDWTRTTTPPTTLTTPIYTLTTCVPIYTTYSPNTTPTLPSTERPTTFETTERPTTFETTERPTTFVTTVRPTTFETTERPTTFVTTVRPTTFETTERPTTFETTERPTTVVTTNGIPSWTTQKPRDDLNAEQTIKCPSSRQAYLPHPKDCNKYFICILDMPILTSCPNGLYWDQKAEFCDTAENVHCFQK
ncbi:uncharacterized protein LOC119668895 [Teleopsis dalmanni]|uniref:uncharacterized protein LOC119668895 n=1 Tax=Teleopsis dalmanni TaxID=139649 RepID=UPI0018CEC74E|nr:uncharacterized protein LOC119668895 [Teleopsis dalmanni]